MTYLFAWNPIHETPPSLKKEIEILKRHNSVVIDWRSGSRLKLPIGSRAFMIRLGSEPKGLIGSGWTRTEPIDSPPWLKIEFDVLRETPYIPFEILQQRPPFSKFKWSIQGSGVQLPDTIASHLEILWEKQMSGKQLSKPSADDNLSNAESIKRIVGQDLDALLLEELTLKEGGKVQRFTNYYERRPNVRVAAIYHHGTTCNICGFDFEEYYGIHGAGFIEVHHLRPVSGMVKETTINPRTEMTTVCSNCHRMLHRRKNKALSPKELRKFLKAAGQIKKH